MRINANSLPPPHLVVAVDDSTLLRTQEGQLPFHHRPDPQVLPRRFRVSWSNVPGPVAGSIVNHHDDHPHAVWQLKLPGGELARVQWSSPPSIQWAPGAFASVSGEVEEALAYD